MPSKHTAPPRDEQLDLLESLEATQRLLRLAHDEFNRADAPELVEAAVYEIKMLQARYSYLLRRAKELDITGGRPGARSRRERRERSA